MDIALTITLLFFISAFISAGLVIQFTTIAALKKKLHEQEEEMGQHYSNAAEIDRDLRQELHLVQLHVIALEKELEVRKFIMNSDRIKYFPWWKTGVEKDNIVRYLAGKLGNEPLFYNDSLTAWWIHIESNNYII